MKLHVNRALIVLLLAAALVTGCNKDEGRKVATQVAASVNAEEITVHQVNDILARRQNVPPERADQAKREVLESLISQQLARQQAIKAGLDRSPEVIQAIEAAKIEVLARAHLAGIVRTLPKPAPQDVRKYYSDHPELFAQRRIFRLEEVVFVANDDVVRELQKQLSDLRSMKEVVEWLKAKGIEFTVQHGVRAAEQIPLQRLPKMQAMKKGQMQLFDETGGHFHVIRVVDFLSGPVDEAMATPRIQQFLFNENSRKEIAREMKELRGRATIEYFGEFASSPRAGIADGQPKVEYAVQESPGGGTDAERQVRSKSDGFSTGQSQK